jgi:WD40 repeat protein
LKEFKISTKYPINYLVFTKNCIWASSEGCIVVLHETGEIVKEFQKLSGYHLCVVNDYVWVCSNNEILIFDTNTLKLEQKIEIPNDNSQFMRKIDNHVWVATTLNHILVFDSITNTKIFQITNAHEFRINDIINVDDSVWTASDDDTIAIWTKKVKVFIYYFLISFFYDYFFQICREK